MFYEFCLNNTKTNTLFWQIIGIYLRTLQALMKGDDQPLKILSREKTYFKTTVGYYLEFLQCRF